MMIAQEERERHHRELRERYHRAINRLAKWRMVFADWQLGTRSATDPECQAVRELFNTMVTLRSEVNALTTLLMRSGVFTEDDFMRQIIDECAWLERHYERKFPGFTSTDTGIDIDTAAIADTMRNWRP